MKKILTQIFKKKSFTKQEGISIGIVGGCQCLGLREATLSLVPHARVSSWHAGVNPETPNEILASLKECDLVISQITPGHNLEMLEMSALRSELKQVHFMPTVVFPGFHPDMAYIFDNEGLLPAVHSDFHSKIAVAAYLLGFAPSRAAQLYNALVFSELGYFEDFDAARIVFEQKIEEGGLSSAGLIEHFLHTIGPFMYMANHPHIQVLAHICRELYVKIGLIDASNPLPVVAKDHLAESFTWPIYPALAKRVGIEGSMNFQKPAWLATDGQAREFSMQTYLADVFAFYSTIDRKRLESEPILAVRDTILPLL